MLARALTGIVDSVLPPRCPACGIVTAADHLFCTGCFGRFRLLAPPWCAQCGEPFELAVPEGTICTRCAADPPAFAAARAVVAYEEPAKSLVLRLKHADATPFAGTMAVQMARLAGDWLVPAARIVPVPLHRWRLWRRGYNQAALIARALSRRTKVPAVLDALVRTRATPPSAGLGREERRANVMGAFASHRPERIAGRPVILVDDVLTSGATAHACALALIEAGASEVRALAYARVAHGARPHHTDGAEESRLSHG